jgi:CubicO group peptidase (beta-lactamase class C family)
VGKDRVQPGRIGFAAGLQRNTQASLFGPRAETVGHTGWGGSAAWADPEAGFSAAYLMNRKGTHLFADDRRARLIDAVYACL